MSYNFDPEFYLESNPDVKSAVANGQFASAYEHWEQHGWREGRDPNAWFDSSYYLEQNPDVADADIDPLLHFVVHGAREGRTPSQAVATALNNPLPGQASTAFDEAAYLDANPDVAAAIPGGFVSGYNHWILYGQFEGRDAMWSAAGLDLSDIGSQLRGDDFNLTAGVDTVTGTISNDLFIADYVSLNGVAQATLNPTDILDGGAGDDILRVKSEVSGQNVIVPAADISGIEKLDIWSTYGDVTANVGGYDGLTAVDIVYRFGQKYSAPHSEVTTLETNANVKKVAVYSGHAGSITDTSDADTLEEVTFTKFANNGGTAEFTVRSDAFSTLNLNDTRINVTIEAADQPRTLTVVTNGTTYSKVTDPTASAVEVKSLGTKSALTLSTETATSLSINAEAALQISLFETAQIGQVDVVSTAGSSVELRHLNTDIPVTIDATAANGGLDISSSVLGAHTTFLAGSGQDIVRAETYDQALSLNAGDDILYLDSTSLGTSGLIDGGTGVDRLEMSLENASSTEAALRSQIANFEILSLSRAVAGDATTTVDLQNFNGINYVQTPNAEVGASSTGETQNIYVPELLETGVYAGEMTVGGIKVVYDGTERMDEIYRPIAEALNGQILTAPDSIEPVRAEYDGGGVYIYFPASAGDVGLIEIENRLTNLIILESAKPPQASDDGQLNLINYANDGTLELTSSGAGAHVSLADDTGGDDVFTFKVSSSRGNDNSGTLQVDNVETVNLVTANATGGALPLIPAKATLISTSATAVTVSGDTGLELTNTGNTAITTFDASGVKAASETLTGSALGVTFVSDNADQAAQVTITGGEGDDHLTGNDAADTITGGKGVDVLTGGAGNDLFIVTPVAGSTLEIDTITDFSSGDAIRMSNAQASSGLVAVTVSANSLDEYLAAAAKLSSTAPGDQNVIGWFQFAGNTYVVQDNDTANQSISNGVDAVVKLTGLIDLSETAITGDSTFTLQ
ncbi:calcium-binding protein [Roseibium sp. CAU 1637]|uniref:Calcium-binding protein n=1 Tax=Roseibium limicola TaxID=2816037 RepID=A0A939EQQ5_9HYPH|nr:calcium-binding protein [Roseibium limicola]MBO0346842.1 calcium-binding protein [Roseibium limicola]